MNYRHEFHAGNFADVVKHLALVAILLHLKKKETPFAVIDTHAGRGLYDLGGETASRTGEAESGIGRIRDLKDGPETLRTYLDLVSSVGERHYPGSPLLSARLLRPQDRLVAIEKHPEDVKGLRHALSQFRKASVREADGYRALSALLPPTERRGLVLIDPPYEATDEFEKVTQALREGLCRFATGIFAVWFPIKAKRTADAFCGEIAIAGAAKTLRIDIDTRPEPGSERLSAAGLVIVNPPFGLGDTMREVLAMATPRLGSSREHAALSLIAETAS
jgi:23S rRNA (adenine2030-N6)-methyltransferase